VQNKLNIAVIFIMIGGFAVAIAAHHENKSIYPAKISESDVAGKIFEREDVNRRERDNGNVTLDVTTLLSSDGKFASGMYRSGKSRLEIDEPYGVDEFMFFLEGGVTLTSSDGSVMEVNAGEGVTIPKEWTGTWESDGYSKIWVIYSEDGSGL